MATSQTLEEEDAIVLATVNKFIELGQEASERIVNGKTPEKQDDKAEKILQLLTAYRRKDRLNDDNLESLLNAMKMLSGANSFPSVDPIIGQAVIYRVTGITDGGGGGGGSGDSRPTFDSFDPSGGVPPTIGSGTANAIKKGDQFYASDGTPGPGDGNPIGNVFGQDIYQGCVFTAKDNGAGDDRDLWHLSQDGY